MDIIVGTNAAGSKCIDRLSVQIRPSPPGRRYREHKVARVAKAMQLNNVLDTKLMQRIPAAVQKHHGTASEIETIKQKKGRSLADTPFLSIA